MAISVNRKVGLAIYVFIFVGIFSLIFGLFQIYNHNVNVTTIFDKILVKKELSTSEKGFYEKNRDEIDNFRRKRLISIAEDIMFGRESKFTEEDLVIVKKNSSEIEKIIINIMVL